MKWYGFIGFSGTYEDENNPGIWEEKIIEKPYAGDMLTDRRKRANPGKVNDNLTISNTISIVADPFAVQNCSSIAYATFMGNKWKISDISVEYPRLVLTMGEVYTGEEPDGTSEDS